MNNSDTSHYENVPFEVPENWEWVNIMEILLKLTDGTHHSPKNYPKGNYKYITAKNIKNEGIVLDDVTYVDDETHHEIFSRCNPEYGDILYIKDGATTGVVAINNLTEDFSLLSSVALLKPSKLVSNKYLFYYLQSPYCYESVRSSMKGVGITRITLKQIADWDVPIPPIGEQHRIVEYIDSFFSQIDLIAKDTSTLKSFLEKYKHGILDLAIAGKLVPQDPSEEPAVELLLRINPTYKSCDNRHYENLPSGWQEVAFEHIFKSIPTKRFQVQQKEIQPKGTVPVISQSANYIEGYTDDIDKIFTATPVIVFGDHTRVVKFVDFPFVVGADGVKIYSTKIFPPYGYYLIEHAAHNIENKGYGRHSQYLAKQRYPLPPYDEQKRIVESIRKMFMTIDSIVADL